MKDSTARKLKGLPTGYLAVGVDPHKKRHAAVAITQDLTVRGKFKFANSRAGFEEALERARGEMGRANCRGVIFAIEAASHFWRNLAYFLEERGVPFRLVNAFTLKRRREGKDLNRNKNDFRDALVGAQLLWSGEFTETKLPQGVYAELRAGYNAYRRLVEERTGIKNLLKGLLDGLFPEFTQIFKDPCGQTALSVLATCPVPRLMAAMPEGEFVALIRGSHRGSLMKKKVKALHWLARTSIGINQGCQAVAAEVQFLVERLHLIGWQVERIKKVLVSLVNETEEGQYLLSIPGVNYISVAGLLAELGPFRSYSNAKQLIKMAGTNPTACESAGKSKSHTPMSKKGRGGLRYCAWNAVIPLLRHNPDFRAWGKRFRERPAHAHPLNAKEVIGAALNRLLRLAFALVNKQCLYRLPQPVAAA